MGGCVLPSEQIDGRTPSFALASFSVASGGPPFQKDSLNLKELYFRVGGNPIDRALTNEGAHRGAPLLFAKIPAHFVPSELHGTSRGDRIFLKFEYENLRRKMFLYTILSSIFLEHYRCSSIYFFDTHVLICFVIIFPTTPFQKHNNKYRQGFL
jgi:hypothetical protein